MKFGLCCSVFLIVLAVLVVTPCHVADAAGLTLYDNFSAAQIDPNKWYGQEGESNSSYPVLRENLRQIQGGRLHLTARAWACTGCGDDGTFYGQNRLRALDLKNATTLQTTVQVMGMEVSNKSLVNTDPALVRARFLGFFFNDGTSSGPGDATGDVYAWIGVHRTSDSMDPEDELSVDAYVKKCDDSGCKFNQTILGKIDKLGTLKVGASATLKMQWVKARHKFIFTLVQGSIKTTREIDYGIFKVVNLPITNMGNRRLEVHCEAPNSTTSPRPTAFMDAYFDSVFYK